jgi:hypothetical protein
MLDIAHRIVEVAKLQDTGISIITYPVQYYSAYSDFATKLRLALNEVVNSEQYSNQYLLPFGNDLEKAPYFRKKILDNALLIDNLYTLEAQRSLHYISDQKFKDDYFIAYPEYRNFMLRYEALKRELIINHQYYIGFIPTNYHHLIYEIIAEHMIGQYVNSDWEQNNQHVLMPDYLFAYLRNYNPQSLLFRRAYNTYGVYHLDKKLSPQNDYIEVTGMRKGGLIETIQRYTPLLDLV